jgi:hypothetical protein
VVVVVVTIVTSIRIDEKLLCKILCLCVFVRFIHICMYSNMYCIVYIIYSITYKRLGVVAAYCYDEQRMNEMKRGI